ncbi:MAG: hypothetical protein LC637_02805 [Xanthomonadaceae bacterium]|nr:hypothetical protein [Xanthomonadaceae bacterium]
MNKSMTVRNVPGSTCDELAARAARSGQSLQEYLRGQLIALAERPDNLSLLQAIRERKRQTGSSLSAEQILELRDVDRR